MFHSGHRQKVREVVIITTAFVLSLFLLRQSVRSPEYLSPLDRGILTLVSPVQSAFATLARSIGHAAGRYVDLVHVRAENGKLRNDNDHLRAELLEAKRGAAESVRFQHLLGLPHPVASETLVARVIAIDVSPFFPVARIQLDRGESLVQRGMPVITPEGVVGRINRTSGETSDIMLSVDPRSAIDVVLPRTGGRGILKGKPGENGYRCAIEYLMQGDQAKDGDLVVTSGLGGFPRDLPLGKISKVVKNSAGLTQDIEITPDVDFARLSEVLVVVAPAPPADPAAGSKKPLAPAHGLAVYR